MDKLFFFVTNSQAWKDTREFHENFFVTHNAFMYGVLTAIIVALVLALVFYFGCCNKRNDDSMANTGVWAGFLLVTGLLVFLTANFAFIGKSNVADSQSIFYKHSFYKANSEFVIEKTRDNQNQQQVDEYTTARQKIETDLNNGKDVRYSYSLGCTVYSLLFFYIFSLLFKGFTYQGIAIPHPWPHKSK